MAVSAAILEIFNVKECPDLEIWVWGPSRSLKKARFDRPCMTFYYSGILPIALSACDGRTDGQTDVQPISITCFSIADARKNGFIMGNTIKGFIKFLIF